MYEQLLLVNSLHLILQQNGLFVTKDLACVAKSNLFSNRLFT
jgi:hypothetical protein